MLDPVSLIYVSTVIAVCWLWWHSKPWMKKKNVPIWNAVLNRVEDTVETKNELTRTREDELREQYLEELVEEEREYSVETAGERA